MATLLEAKLLGGVSPLPDKKDNRAAHGEKSKERDSCDNELHLCSPLSRRVSEAKLNQLLSRKVYAPPRNLEPCLPRLHGSVSSSRNGKRSLYGSAMHLS